MAAVGPFQTAAARRRGNASHSNTPCSDPVIGSLWSIHQSGRLLVLVLEKKKKKKDKRHPVCSRSIAASQRGANWQRHLSTRLPCSFPKTLDNCCHDKCFFFFFFRRHRTSDVARGPVSRCQVPTQHRNSTARPRLSRAKSLLRSPVTANEAQRRAGCEGAARLARGSGSIRG